MDLTTVVMAGYVPFGLLGWLLFFRERRRSVDYVTDLMQLVHDYDLTREDLRRSLGWKEVEDNFERGNNG